MDKVSIDNKEKYIFGNLFLLSNKLQVIMDRNLSKYDMTAKQWFLTAMIEEYFKAPPTLSELAQAMGSTHQNVKQIALKLQNKEFLQMVKDEEDRRVTRIKLTEKSRSFWENRDKETNEFLNQIFQDLNDEELSAMFFSLNRLYNNLLKMEEK